MPSPIVQAMIQSGALGAFANVLAQTITAFRAGVETKIDWLPVIQFLLFNLISTPPNFLWQDFLESAFPAYPQPTSDPKSPKYKDTKRPPPQLSIRNTVLKLLLDQTVGAVLNTLLFSSFTHSLRQATLPSAPITSLPKALSYWTTPGTVDFRRVDWGLVWEACLVELWPIIVAGFKLWPAVSVINFTLIKSVEGRNLVGALAGVIWGVYMSFVSAQ